MKYSKDKITINIDYHGNNMEGEEEIYCLIDGYADNDYTFTSREHMYEWAEKNNFEIVKIQYI